MKACVFIAFRNCGLSSPEFNSECWGEDKNTRGSASGTALADQQPRCGLAYGCESDQQAQALGPAEGGLGLGAASICHQHRASGFKQPIPDFPCLVRGHANTDVLCERFCHLLIKHSPAHMYTVRNEAVGPQHTVSGYSGTTLKRMISRETGGERREMLSFLQEILKRLTRKKK